MLCPWCMKYLGAPQSGSQANTTASHNRAGQYYRNRRTPTQPVGTGRRAIVRSNFSSASGFYSTLTAMQQAAWSAYAAMYPIRDALGQSIVLTGHQMCLAVNANLLNAGFPMNPLPPVNQVLDVITDVALEVSLASAWSFAVTPAPSGTNVYLLAFSAPQSSGTSFCKVFWQMEAAASADFPLASFKSSYEAQFGVPAVGNRIFYKVTPVNQYGVAGAPTIGFSSVIP